MKCHLFNEQGKWQLEYFTETVLCNTAPQYLNYIASTSHMQNITILYIAKTYSLTNTDFMDGWHKAATLRS